MVIEFNQLRDRGIQREPLDIAANAKNCLPSDTGNIRIWGAIRYAQFAARLVDNVAPKALKKTVQAHNIPRVPRL
jgi:hypothetical protein